MASRGSVIFEALGEGDLRESAASHQAFQVGTYVMLRFAGALAYQQNRVLPAVHSRDVFFLHRFSRQISNSDATG